MTPDDCDDCCVGFICASFGCCCTFRTIKKSTRIKVLWTWLILSMTTSCVLLGCVLYSPDHPMASPSDMIPIRNHINFLFCEEVRVSSPGLSLTGYVVSGDLEISWNKRLEFNQSTALFVDRESFRYIPFFFIEGTVVKLRHCSKTPLVFYVIKGIDNFDTWKRKRECEDCYYERRFIAGSDNCETFRTADIYMTEIYSEDEYVFIYSNDKTGQTWVNLDISLDRRLYDIDSASVSCAEVTDCELILATPKDTAVIWIDSNYDLANDENRTLTTKCVPRIWAYLIIHGFPVLFIGISVSIIIQKTCTNPNTRQNRITERSPLLISSNLPPTYSSVYMSPPKYEDIIRDSGPPSYTEAISHLAHSDPNLAEVPSRQLNHCLSDSNQRDTPVGLVHSQSDPNSTTRLQRQLPHNNLDRTQLVVSSSLSSDQNNSEADLCSSSENTQYIDTCSSIDQFQTPPQDNSLRNCPNINSTSEVVVDMLDSRIDARVFNGTDARPPGYVLEH